MEDQPPKPPPIFRDKIAIMERYKDRWHVHVTKPCNIVMLPDSKQHGEITLTNDVLVRKIEPGTRIANISGRTRIRTFVANGKPQPLGDGHDSVIVQVTAVLRLRR